MKTGLDLNLPSDTADIGSHGETIGCLMYLTADTRPDISFSVCRLAKFVESPTKLQCQAVKRVFRFLLATRNYGLCYQRSESLEPHGYVDSDRAGDTSTRKSTSGYVFMMTSAAVRWSARLQEVIALSLTEAEYVSLTTATKDPVWLMLEVGPTVSSSVYVM